MSSESRPITNAQFRLAIQDLPIENIYAKAHEIENSIAHLRRSNAQLKEYSDSIRQDTSLSGEVRDEVGDRECLQAIEENEKVIERQMERVGLLKDEVERRGRVWHEGGGGVAPAAGDDDGEVVNGVNGSGGSTAAGAASRSGGRLSDDELRRQMLERMSGQDADDEDDDGSAEGGMHL